MSDNSSKETSADEPAKKGNQRTHQPADEEIGDYADPDAIQADGGDNSFIADEPVEAAVPGKKPAAK
ncbi:MAG: hypothetical protein ABWY05_12505 [Noviherbaspirillum sp.]